MESTFRFIGIRLLLALMMLALLGGVVWAQGTGEITGLVTDPSGAVISGANIALTNTATGEKRSTVTTSAGAYRFPELSIVGTYNLQATMKGFKAVKVAGIVVSVGTIYTKDLKLELGATTETVTVEAGAETVQTSESQVSQLVDRNIWQNMPLEVRNQNSFIELVAGANSQDDSGNNRGAAVNGTREGAGSYLVEGTDNNEQGQAGRGQLSAYDKGGAATSISPDAIQEYRVITNSFSAEYGKGGGFITDTVLKSGTNQLHGSLFEYNRIQALAANDWFSNREGNKDRLVRNQFGGSLGGPLIKDKTFVYGTVEFHRVRQTAPAASVDVPTQQFIDFVGNGGLANWAESDPGGLCMKYTGSSCPGVFHNTSVTGGNASTLGPTFSAVRALPGEHYPVANPNNQEFSEARGLWTARNWTALHPTDGPLTFPVPAYGTVSLPDPQDQNEWRMSIKFDHRFSERDSINVIYLNQTATYHDTFAGGNNTIGPLYTQTGKGQNWGITWNHTFTPTFLNTFKASYLRHRNDFPSPLGAPGYYSYLADVGADMGNYAGLPQFFTDTQFQYLDTMSVQKGKHNIKFGGEYRRTRNASSFYLDTYGTILPWSAEDTMTDLAFSDAFENYLTDGTHYYGGAYYMKAAVNSATGGLPDPYRGFRANEVAFFGQDDWRVSSRLTVNLGLRWEYFGPPHNFKPNIDSNFYFGVPVTPIPTNSANEFFPANSPFFATVATGTFQVRNAGIWNKDTNNFGPRAGFAYDVFGNQKLVVRAGAGIMYDRIYNNVFENIRFNPPYFSDNTIFSPIGPYSTPGLFTYPLADSSRAMFNGAGAAKPLPNPRHMDQNMVTPYYEQVHFGFQWEFLKGYVFEPNYVGTFGHKLIGLSDINTFDGRTAFGSSCTAGNSYRGCRPNLNIGADNYRSNGYSSNYHGLQLSVRKNYSNGLGLTANYTYAKSLDTVSDLFNNRAGAHPTDNENIRYDYGPSDFNVAQRFVSTVSYQLPFAKENRWIGGWGVNTIISRQTGHPLSPYSTKDVNRDGYGTDRVIPTVPLGSTIHHGNPADGYLDRTQWAQYTCPASVNSGLWCNVPIGRGSITGPGFTNVDFSATKRFKITESSGLTFQANFFDLFNHPNFVIPARNWSAQGTFGKSPLTLGDSGGHRITQLALRFDF